MSNEDKPSTDPRTVSSPTSSMTDNLVNELKRNINSIHQGLVSDVDSVTGEMPESVFVNYFLPRFFDPDKFQDNWVSQYIAIAGSPSCPVRIFKDGDSSKQTMYFAPPMFSSTRVSPRNHVNRDKAGSEIENVFAHARMMSANDAYGGENLVNKYLEASFRNKLGSLEAAQEESAKVWASLYLRYGFVDPSQFQSSNAESDQGPDNSIDSLIDE